MSRLLIFILYILCVTAGLQAHSQEIRQQPLKKDSAAVTRPRVTVADTTTVAIPTPVQLQPVDHSNSGYAKVLRENPWFNFFGKAVIRTISTRRVEDKDGLFYLFGFLFFLLALVKASFGRYFQHLFTVFFRASMKQKQIREQLLQTPLASLLLNLLFVAVGGLYAAFIIHDRPAGMHHNFWLLYAWCVGGLTLIYLGKFFLLKILGWTLRMQASTDTYIFIVFLCNKILGIFLLPLLLVAAFARKELVTVAMTVSYVLVVGIFLYRYISAYGYINREVRTSRFHFFLYLCAFEVAPLLLIYKVLLKFV